MSSATVPIASQLSQLSQAERADVERETSRMLARQSVPGVLVHVVLTAILIATTSVAASHPRRAWTVGAWMVALGGVRLAVARAVEGFGAARPATWRALFRAGALASSASWGLVGALLVHAAGFAQDTWLTLIAVAGVGAGGVSSLAGDYPLARAHVASLLLPVMVTGALAADDMRVVGFELVVGSFAVFLLIQGSAGTASIARALTTSRLLERHAAALDKARQSSVEASRVKSDFLANMSHEIRTPLASVIGYADLLLDPALGPSDRVNYLQTVRRNGVHLLELINDILDVSKIEAGKMQVERIPVSPARIAADVASLMRVRAAEKGLQLGLSFDGPIPGSILGDSTRLRQIVMNFVGNAVKFTDQGGVRIVVRCEGAPDTGRLVVEVLDTGIGMTEKQLRGLFQKFVQADASTTRKYGGTGLGLVISKQLANLMGGDVQVESARGRGTTFRLTVPTGPLDPADMLEGLTEAGLRQAPDTGPAFSEQATPYRVLLAEDGVDNQRLISAYLRKTGATVRVVGDGAQAVTEVLAAVEAGRPYDVVLMDMQMPELDGYGAAGKLRFRGYRGPIVALTAHAMTGDRERCLAAGCDDYLTKPIDRAALVETLTRMCGGRDGAVLTPQLATDLADDTEMKELIAEFVERLPERSSEIQRAAKSADWEAVSSMAHKLKGSAGGYGFPSITEAAAQVERVIREGAAPEAVDAAARELAELCRRARAA